MQFGRGDAGRGLYKFERVCVGGLSGRAWGVEDRGSHYTYRFQALFVIPQSEASGGRGSAAGTARGTILETAAFVY